MHTFIKDIKCKNVQLKYLMFQAVVCIECRALCESHTARHSIQTTTSNIFLPQHCWTNNDVFFYWQNPQNCNFSKARHRLPEDGPDGPKHV